MIALGVILILINIVGGGLLYLWGDFWFPHIVALLIACFSLGEAAIIFIALFGPGNYSYLITRATVKIYFIIIIISTIRIGIAAYELEANKYLISSECWGAVDAEGVSPVGTAAAFYCNLNIDNFIQLFIVGFIAEYILNVYFFFVMWRWYRKMQVMYQIQKDSDMPTGMDYEAAYYAS